MRTTLLLTAITLCFGSGSALAAVVPAPVFSDHMVLQRQMAVPVWGTAEAVEAVPRLSLLLPLESQLDQENSR